jgi:hypothetical protein
MVTPSGRERYHSRPSSANQVLALDPTECKPALPRTPHPTPAPAPRRIAGELLAGAIDFARSQGAATLQACAVDTTQAGKTPSADLYRGPLSVYLSAGFTELSRTSRSWVLVSRQL